MTTMTYEPITLINADYRTLSVNISYQKAARLLSKGKVVVDQSVPGRFLGPWEWPVVLRLKDFVKVAYERLHGPPRVSKRGVLLRDGHRCVYCGKEGHTIDHIMPRSRGGLQSWRNLACACKACNHRKGNRTPEEAGMTLLWHPFAPKKNQIQVPLDRAW